MPLRALKTDEEISAIPLDQEILIELPSATIDEPDIPEPKTPKRTEPDAGAKTLQEQLEAAQAAQRASDERAARAERDATEARRLASEREREATEARARSASLEGDVISGGLSAAQAERDAAKQEFKRAFDAGDPDAMANAQSRMGRAEAKILTYEAGAAEIAERREAPAESQQQQTRQAPADPMAAIDTNPNLFAEEKVWLKAHPDAVTDTKRNNELVVAYERALRQGLVRGTPDYFAYLNEFMGYEKPANNQSNQERDRQVQAPPSRNDRGSDGRPSNSTVSLSPEERKMAAELGVSEKSYAIGKQELAARKRSDPDKYGT